MQLTKEAVVGVVDTYIRAWVGQDPDLITTVFTEDATYHERVMDDPVILGHEGIRAYWRSKVVESQADISCRLLSLYLDGATAIAEWEAEFDDVADGVRKRMREVAILEFREDRIERLREYWATQTVPAVVSAPRPTGPCG